MRYSIEPITRKYVKGYGFWSFKRSLSSKNGKQLLDAATKAELDALKTATKKVSRKTAKAIGEVTGNKIADKIVKSHLCLIRTQKMLKK